MIYLDNAATTKPYDAVIEKMHTVLANAFGNPSSLHHTGIEAERLMEDARKSICNLLGAREGRFLFTSGGTEANNLAILGTMMSRIKRTPRIIISPIEHPSVAEPVAHLSSLGADCVPLRVDRFGRVDATHLATVLQEGADLVSIMMTNNEIGTTQDIPGLVRLVKEISPKTLFHTDAVQAFGKIPFSVSALGVDLLSVSGHKINGPKGVGGLYVKSGVHVKPILFGGGQEEGLRSGTENVPAIAGFGVAAELTGQDMPQRETRLNSLKTRLLEGLSKIPGCRVIQSENGVPHIVCASFPGIKSETLLHMLEHDNIFVSSGSACSSNKPRLSPTLLAIGCDKKEIEGAIRISMGKDTCEGDINSLLFTLAEKVPSLLAVSR